LTRLQKGESVGMPDARPMPNIGAGASEIRIGERSGQYSAIYAIRMKFGILLFHAFQKKSRTMLEREKKAARDRLEDFLKELGEAPMKRKDPKAGNYASAKTPDDLGRILGLTPCDIALMKYKAELSTLAVRAIEESGMPLNEIVKRSGVARSKVSAVRNGATVSISCDLLVKIIGATGLQLQPNAA
jgi:phage-related protein